jgi:hypothetical protein
LFVVSNFLSNPPARRNRFSLRPAHAGTGLAVVSPSGFARNSRRTPRPSSASTTPSRSPSSTSTNMAFQEIGRASCSIFSGIGRRTNLTPISTSSELTVIIMRLTRVDL